MGGRPLPLWRLELSRSPCFLRLSPGWFFQQPVGFWDPCVLPGDSDCGVHTPSKGHLCKVGQGPPPPHPCLDPQGMRWTVCRWSTRLHWAGAVGGGGRDKGDAAGTEGNLRSVIMDLWGGRGSRCQQPSLEAETIKLMTPGQWGGPALPA